MKPVVIITGLPFFGGKICQELQKFDKDSNYIFLNTYYKRADQLKYLCYIGFCRTVYSINGAIGGSFVLWLAVMLRKKIVMHWVGSDLIEARQRISQQTAKKELIHRPIHLTDTPWYVEPLRELGIKAQYSPLISLGNERKLLPFPDHFAVLAYIPESNPDFYGLNTITEAAVAMPDTDFFIAGLNHSESLPSNIKALGWVDNMETVFAKTVVAIRMPLHDGLSVFILEALAYGRYVLYNQPFPLAIQASDSHELINGLNKLKSEFDNGSLNLNTTGHEYVLSNFSKEAVLLKLQSILL